ncbi:hypothetical protein [Cytobacillus firmus]|nr:hypothetical protein [Cytobacillus firmus]
MKKFFATVTLAMSVFALGAVFSSGAATDGLPTQHSPGVSTLGLPTQH